MADGDFSFPIAPNWIKSPAQDINELYAQGAQLGARAAMERARLQEASIQAQADLAMKSAALQQEAQNQKAVFDQNVREANQRNLMTKAYQDAQIGIRQQQLDRQMQEFKAKSAVEARRFAGQQRVGAALKAGTPIERALFESPEMLTPGVTEAIVRRQGTAAKNYGAPTLMPVPGAPGTSIAYREGSPAMHVVTGKNQGLNPWQSIQARKEYGKVFREWQDAVDENGASSNEAMVKQTELRALESALKQSRQQGPVPIPPPQTATATSAPEAALPPPRRTGFVMPPEVSGAPAAAAAQSPFKEGQIVRSKKDGKRYRIVNGEPVEITE